MAGFDALEFGRVLARLDSQDRALIRMEQEMHELAENVNKLTQIMCSTPREKKKGPDWLELLVGSILGAVFFFIGEKIMGH